MFAMNSVLTMEERRILQSLECESKEQALDALRELKMVLPLDSEIFAGVIMLSEKLLSEKIDFVYEMRADDGFDEDIFKADVLIR